MANNASFADMTLNWGGLLAAVREHAGLLSGVEPHLEEMESTLGVIQTLKDRQDSFRATKQRTTQELDEALTRGREAAIRLRGFVRAKLGPKNELLVQFGVTPNRPRSRQRSAAKPGKEQATGTTPKPAPAAQP